MRGHCRHCQVLGYLLNVVPLPKTLLADSAPWKEVVLLYRRICLLRATSNEREAAELERTELNEAIATLHSHEASGEEKDTAARLNTIFAAEEERMANASVLASLLVPLLRDALAPVLGSERGVNPTRKSPPMVSPPREPGDPRAAVASPLGVADFIEGMLVQDRARAPRPTS